jgi:hypothetical protein
VAAREICSFNDAEDSDRPGHPQGDRREGKATDSATGRPGLLTSAYPGWSCHGADIGHATQIGTIPRGTIIITRTKFAATASTSPLSAARKRHTAGLISPERALTAVLAE